MSTDVVLANQSTPVIATNQFALPAMIERAGAVARFAWDEFFYAEHHHPHTQKAYMAAVKRFLAWAQRQGVELPSTTPGMLGQYLVALRGSPAKRNLHLSALRGFFDRLVQRHVVILNPAASVRGVSSNGTRNWNKAANIPASLARRGLRGRVDSG
jgi:site-specific recombinase XerC